MFGRTVDYIKSIGDRFGLLTYTFRNILYMVPKDEQEYFTLTDDDIIDDPHMIDGGLVVKTTMIGRTIGHNVVL